MNRWFTNVRSVAHSWAQFHWSNRIQRSIRVCCELFEISCCRMIPFLYEADFHLISMINLLHIAVWIGDLLNRQSRYMIPTGRPYKGKNLQSSSNAHIGNSRLLFLQRCAFVYQIDNLFREWRLQVMSDYIFAQTKRARPNKYLIQGFTVLVPRKYWISLLVCDQWSTLPLHLSTSILIIIPEGQNH